MSDKISKESAFNASGLLRVRIAQFPLQESSTAIDLPFRQRATLPPTIAGGDGDVTIGHFWTPIVNDAALWLFQRRGSLLGEDLFMEPMCRHVIVSCFAQPMTRRFSDAA
jgi:hypothetical protein